VTDLLRDDRRTWHAALVLVCAAASFAIAGATPAYAATVHETITRCTTAAGFGSLDVAAMKKIADYESHDRPKSHSKTCWGLFQLSTAVVAGHPWSDADWNTRRALKYIKRRYKTPRAAWTHIKRTGWY
jgi:hypothetical protein